ncbi:hypothetical protein AAIB48_17390 [Paraclostridium benzoelyticum]
MLITNLKQEDLISIWKDLRYGTGS